MRRLMILLVLTGLGFDSVPAQQPPTGGFLFAYATTDRASFEAGYRRHLDWHRTAGDSLTWFGWDVLVGSRPGVFVDGFFGAPFEALDVRVDPAGDQADATENVLAHADPVDRELVAIRRDLSTATPLEDSTPTVFVEVVWYEVAPGQIETFAGTLAGLRREASDRSLLPYSVYERVAGAEIGFIIMVWRDRLSTFDEQRRSPRRALERILSELPAGNVSISIVRSVKSEVWLYRPDLTYLGSRGGAR
jgi:hypothetical protein